MARSKVVVEHEFTPFVTERRLPNGELVSVTVDIKKDTRINVHDLTRELSEQAGKYGWYVQLAEAARKEMKRARYEEHKMREDLMNKYRQREEDNDVPKAHRLNETQMKVKIYRSRRMRATIESRMEWDYRVHVLDGYVKVMEQRSRMLQSLNAHLATEHGSTR